jgi:hypothetical protein
VAHSLGVSLDSFSITVSQPKITDPKFVVFDITETERIFGWKPKEDINMAIENCVNKIKSSSKQVRQHH